MRILPFLLAVFLVLVVTQNTTGKILSNCIILLYILYISWNTWYSGNQACQRWLRITKNKGGGEGYQIFSKEHFLIHIALINSFSYRGKGKGCNISFISVSSPPFPRQVCSIKEKGEKKKETYWYECCYLFVSTLPIFFYFSHFL